MVENTMLTASDEPITTNLAKANLENKVYKSLDRQQEIPQNTVQENPSDALQGIHLEAAPNDPEKELHALCKPRLRAIHDTMDLLSGKWKVAIIGYLHTMGKCRFMQLQRNIEGIGAKMLSKELKDLEINELVTRTVLKTRPITVEYELTDYGKTLQNIINELCSWGFKHREKILKKQTACTCGENPELGCEAHVHTQMEAKKAV